MSRLMSKMPKPNIRTRTAAPEPFSVWGSPIDKADIAKPKKKTV